MACNHIVTPMTRREALSGLGAGFGFVALSNMLSASLAAADKGVTGGVAAVMLLAGGDEPSEALSGLQRITIVAALPFVLVMLLLCVALARDLRRDPLALRARLATTVVERAIRTGVDQHGGVQFDLVTKHECGERCAVDAPCPGGSSADTRN